jgi:DNA-binding response OmpR family regulator
MEVRLPMPAPSVLIVDRTPETREVLKTALEQRGIRVLAAAEAEEGLHLLAERNPDLVVLDLEQHAAAGVVLAGRFAAGSADRRIPLLVLGSGRRELPWLARQQFVAKPYHYSPLIRKIEALLDAA